MRFVDGVDLGGLLAQSGRIPPRRAANLLSQVSSALDAAHARGLIHRDVKPGNILVAEGDHAYLTDFGLSKRATDASKMTQTGMFVGTLDYIAPEQIEGRRIDARTDVYALGCVAYGISSGKVPFDRDSDVAKLFAHVNDPPPRLTGLPEPLVDAVARAMAKDPAERFLSAGDFGRALLAGVEGREEMGAGRAVGRGDATVFEGQTPTELATPTASEFARAAATQGAGGSQGVGPTQAATAGATEPGSRPGGGSGSPRRRALVVGLAGLVALLGVGVAVAFAAGAFKTNTTTTTETLAASTSTGRWATPRRPPPRARPRLPAPAPAPTAVRIFNPVNANGGLAVTATQRTSGSCFTSSIVAARSDAWRCNAGNNLLDPCFTVDQQHVFCPSPGPWANSGALVSVPSLPTGQANKDTGTSGQPWAIQLKDGSQCTEISGATNVIDGQRLGYGCSNQLGLYGNVQRSGTVWMIYTGQPHSAQLTQQPIAIAWY